MDTKEIEELGGSRLFGSEEQIEKVISLSNIGNWEIKDDGDLIYHGDAVNCIKEVEASNLLEIDVAHLMSRVWKDYKDACDFFNALLEASRRAGYDTLTIELNNHYRTRIQ